MTLKRIISCCLVMILSISLTAQLSADGAELGSPEYSGFGPTADAQRYWNLVGAADKMRFVSTGTNSSKISFDDSDNVKAVLNSLPDGQNPYEWKDYVVEAAITLNGNAASNAGVMFRTTDAVNGSSDSYKGYYIGFGPSYYILGRANNNWTEINRSSNRSIAVGVSHTIKIIVYGSKIAIYGDGEEIFNFVDTTYTAGSVGFRAWGREFVADSMTVRPVTAADLDTAFGGADVPNRAVEHVFQMGNTNPFVPGYAADGSIFFDEHSQYYYVFATNDGNGGKNTWPTQLWYSKDLISWEHRDVELPEEWFMKSNDYDEQPHDMVWAPSVIYNPKNQKYYITYTIGSQRIGMSDSLFGPWVDANKVEPNKPFINTHDGQFFLDDDGSIYMTVGAWTFCIIKLDFDAEGKVSAGAQDDPRMNRTSGRATNPFKYYTAEGIRNSFEASEIFKRNGLYYLVWSTDGGAAYNLRYAVADDVFGPYREINGSFDNPILSTDNEKNILGPGHHATFVKGDDYYIIYHRQSYPFVDSKRQTCIEKLNFNADGSIQKIIPSHSGVALFENPEKRTNIALGKQTRVSSARAYAPTSQSNVSFRYSGNFAVDENGGTRWDAGIGAKNPWLIVDLGSDSDISAIQTTFEFTNKKYFYKLETLAQEYAKDIDSAAKNENWRVYVDKTAEGAQYSPVEDKAAGGTDITARYVRITIYKTEGIPETAEAGNKVNGDNAISIFEIKVFGEQTASDLNRVIEAESFNLQSGLTVEASALTGMNICGTNNNDFIMYKNIDLGTGADVIQARVAVGSAGGRVDVRMDAATGPLIGTVDVTDTGGWQMWHTLTAKLSDAAVGKHDIYLVFKADNDREGVANIDWIKFGDASVNKSSLGQMFSLTESELLKDYTPSTLRQLQTVYDNALAVYEDADSTQRQVDDAVIALIRAIESLVYAGGVQAEYYTIQRRPGLDRGAAYPHGLDTTMKKDVLVDDNINFNNMEGLLSQHAGQNDYAGVRWTGRIKAPVTGTYVFTTYTDNGVQFDFDGETNLINWWVNDWEQYKSTKAVTLQEGEIYDFEMRYMEIEGGSCALLYWTIDDGARQIVPRTSLLLPLLDYGKLDSLTAQAKALRENQFTPASWKNMQDSLQEALDVRGGDKILQYQVDAAATDLDQKIKALLPVSVPDWEASFAAAESDGKIDVSAYVSNNTTTLSTVDVVIAEYDKLTGRLLAVDSKQVVLNDSDAEISLTLAVKGDYVLKLFVWDSATYAPKIEPVS